MDHVVVDVEIANRVEDTPGGWEATDLLGVAVACLWDGSRMRVFGQGDVEELKERLLAADRVTTFNGWKFDLPAIWGVRGRVEEMRGESDDLLRRVWQALGLDPDAFVGKTHGGWSLDAVAKATLGIGKIGSGAEAPKWYQAGEICRVVNYCADDVALTRDLCEFIDRHGYVLGKGDRKVLIPQWK